MGVTFKPAGHFPGVHIVVRTHGPYVVVFINGAGSEFLTPDAHRAGFALLRGAIDATLRNELVVLTVNGRDIDLPPPQAKQIGAALLRKSENADDWQLEHRTRAII